MGASTVHVVAEAGEIQIFGLGVEFYLWSRSREMERKMGRLEWRVPIIPFPFRLTPVLFLSLFLLLLLVQCFWFSWGRTDC